MDDLFARLAELDRRVLGALHAMTTARPPAWGDLDAATRAQHTRWLAARLPVVLVVSLLLAALGVTAGSDVALVGFAAVLVPMGGLRVAYARRFAADRD